MSTENRTTANETQVKDALDSIAVIRQVMNRSEVNMSHMGVLFLLYGIFTIFTWEIGDLIRKYYLNAGAETKDELIENITLSNHIVKGLDYVIWAVLLTIFLVIRARMKRRESIYTMKLFDMWGVTLFSAPVMSVLFLLISQIFPISESSRYICSAAIEMLHFGMMCMSLFITGHLTGKRYMKFISVLLILLLPVMMCFSDLSWLGVYDISSIAVYHSMYAAYYYFSARMGFARKVLIAVYVLLGIFFLIKCWREARGNKQHSGNISVEAQADDN